VPNRPDIDEIKRDGWKKHRILVVSADDPRIGWVERKLIEQLGDNLYGGKR